MSTLVTLMSLLSTAHAIEPAPTPPTTEAVAASGHADYARRKMRPVPAFVVGTATGFGAGVVGGFVHPIAGGALMPAVSALAMHPLTDGRLGWKMAGTHLGWLGSSPVGIPVRVIDRRTTGGSLEPLSPGSLALTGAFAVTTALGGLIGSHVDAKKLLATEATVAVTPVVAPGRAGVQLSGSF